MRLRLMDRQWGWNAPWDMVAMSTWATITSLAESPLAEGLLYAGTDDGLIQVSENGGGTWRQIAVGDLPGVPATAFVNDIKADLFAADTVYVALDNHKSGDFGPYLVKSLDRGRSWRSIAGDLPDRHLVWRVVQDHERPSLLVAGTEFGLYASLDGGESWHELGAKTPTIPFRDIAVHRGMDDLVGASFGRGMWVLDDYSCLRELNPDALSAPGSLCPVRDTWWYIPRRPLGGDDQADQGASYFSASNPPFGAILTYHLGSAITSRREQREQTEQDATEADQDTPFPGWDVIADEQREAEPKVVLTVRDSQGHVVRRLVGPTSAGFHRLAWDLRYPDPAPILTVPADEDEAEPPRGGPLAPPGHYTVALAVRNGDRLEPLAGPVEFDVIPLDRGTLAGAAPTEVSAFARRVAEAQRHLEAARAAVGRALERVLRLAVAVDRSTAEPGSLSTDLEQLRIRLLELQAELERLLSEDLAALETRAEAAGAPWTPGRPVPHWSTMRE